MIVSYSRNNLIYQFDIENIIIIGYYTVYMNALTLITGILGFFLLTLIILVIILFRKISRFTRGKNAKSLENIISENNRLSNEIQKKITQHEKSINDIKKDSLHNIQNIGVVRFNPFKEMGGSQSFAIAITDTEKNGVVISSLYTRDRVNIFAKPLVKGSSEYTLTKEEESAINKSCN